MSWYSKKDVLDDLAQAMGGRFKDIDEQHLVIGEQPPPPCTTTEEDDELLLRLNQGLVHDDKKQGPDLAGITEMLRMVDNFDDSEGTGNNICSQKDNTVISISKLNPAVPEFVPKNFENVAQPEKVETTNINGLKEGETSNDFNEIVHSDNIKEISERLKSKIISPSQENICIKMKSERNLAIASLLKLYSNPAETSSVNGKQPKLLTPQHFEKPYINDSKVNSVSQASSSKSPNELSDIKEDKGINQEVDNSLAKVKSWLKMDEKPKNLTKALFLGPVTFKKKENVKPITPNSEVSDKTSRNSPSYVPTELAGKLAETFKMQSKAKEEQNMDIWSKLEKELKARDEGIRRGMLQADSSTSTRARRKNQRAN